MIQYYFLSGMNEIVQARSRQFSNAFLDIRENV